MKPFLTRPLVLTFSSLFLILGSPSLAGEFSLKPASDSLDEGWSNNFALPGLDGTVKAFIVWQGDLYVGGRFAHADGVPVNGIARWDGTAWHALGNGVQGEVLELAVYDNMLAVSVLNANLDGSIAFWDGSNWTSTNLTFNHQGRAYALTVFDDKLVAAGNFNKVVTALSGKGFDLVPSSPRWPKAEDSKHYLGQIFTILLLSLGAPFWFNTLKFPVLRVPKAIANTASRRVSEKQGMRVIAIVERDYVCGRLPAEIWEITAEEWRQQRGSG